MPPLDRPPIRYHIYQYLDSPPVVAQCAASQQTSLAAMNESQFTTQVDQTFRAIEDAVEAANADIDFDQQAGVLTLLFDDGRKLIFSRQAPVKQLWLAAPTGGFHFNWVDGHWQLADSATTLTQKVNELASLISGESISLEF